MTNAKSKKWKIRHIRPLDSIKIVNKVINKVVKQNYHFKIISWSNLKYGQLAIVHTNTEYTGFASRFDKDHVRFYGPFVSNVSNKNMFDLKSWVSGSCFNTKNWDGYTFPPNPIVIFEGEDPLITTKAVHSVVMSILQK